MSNIKIPEGWIFKEFVCEGERTKFVYDDEFGEEHIYYEYQEHIPTYKELEERINKAIELIEQDYFEDGSGEYIEQVLSILRGEDNENTN